MKRSQLKWIKYIQRKHTDQPHNRKYFRVEEDSWNLGISINIIRAVLFFKQKDFTRTKSTKSTKRTKSTKSTKSIKRTKKHKTQRSDFPLLRCYLCAQKAQNVKQTTFFVLDVFMCIKMLSFLFHTEKSTKSTKSTYKA